MEEWGESTTEPRGHHLTLSGMRRTSTTTPALGLAYTPPSSHTTCQAGIAATLAATRRLPGGQKFAHATLTAGSLSVSLW